MELSSHLFKLKLGLLFALSAAVCFPSALYAFPEIDNLVDFNGDREIRIAVLGDSIVHGTADSKKKGGYVGRLKQNFPNAKIFRLGYPGIKSDQLYTKVKKSYQQQTRLSKNLKNIDLLVIEIGTNDYWRFQPTSRTLTYIRRLRNLVTKRAISEDNVAPFIVVTTLPTTLRDFQRPFIQALNSDLLKNKNKLNVRVRFDKLPDTIISLDKLHPSPAGYSKMSKMLKSSLLSSVKTGMLQKRSDQDQDGLYDEIENLRYGTDPTIYDTDGDGLSDGEEILIHNTDPLNPDTDGDGYTDYEEIQANTNPLDPQNHPLLLPSPPPPPA